MLFQDLVNSKLSFGFALDELDENDELRYSSIRTSLSLCKSDEVTSRVEKT